MLTRQTRECWAGDDLWPTINKYFSVSYSRPDGSVKGRVSWHYERAWDGTQYVDTDNRVVFSWTLDREDGFRVYEGLTRAKRKV